MNNQQMMMIPDETQKISSCNNSDSSSDNSNSSTASKTKTSKIRIKTPHPFTRLQNPSTNEIIKMIIGLLSGIVIIKLLLIILTIVVGCSITILFHKFKFQTSKVLSLRITCRILLYICGFYFINVVGDIPNKKSKKSCCCPKIIVSNHLSNIEILHLLTLPFYDSTTGNSVLPVFVTKESVFNIPFIGAITKDVLGSIGVSRTKRNSNGTHTNNLTEQIIDRVNNCNDNDNDNDNDNENDSTGTTGTGPTGPIVIFPEGTTTNGTCLIEFKTGAFVPLINVLPICYSFVDTTDTDGNNKKSNNNKLLPSFIPTYESILTPVYIWRLLSQPYNNLKCDILQIQSPPPPPPSSTPSTSSTQSVSSQSQSVLYANIVRQQMAISLKVPLVNNINYYPHKVQYHNLLREQYKKSKNNPIYTMFFQPMQKVLRVVEENNDDEDGDGDGDNNKKNSSSSSSSSSNEEEEEYDTVIGIITTTTTTTATTLACSHDDDDNNKYDLENTNKKKK
jgi:1-acyl-sn-glycerol-3-phosphate acyltransferase